MLLMIDNYDSFTYNLVHYFAELGVEVKVFRNDAISLEEIDALRPSYVVLSPGPCSPDQAGICLDVVRHVKGRIPLLGVCLGHQAIGQAFGARVVQASKIFHGKLSSIHHTQEGVFKGLPIPFTATRYHSLVLAPDSIPKGFSVHAWTEEADGSKEAIMGIRHHTLPIEGVQFHPESILTEHGHAMLKNFLDRYAGF